MGYYPAGNWTSRPGLGSMQCSTVRADHSGSVPGACRTCPPGRCPGVPAPRCASRWRPASPPCREDSRTTPRRASRGHRIHWRSKVKKLGERNTPQQQLNSSPESEFPTERPCIRSARLGRQVQDIRQRPGGHLRHHAYRARRVRGGRRHGRLENLQADLTHAEFRFLACGIHTRRKKRVDGHPSWFNLR